MRRLLGIFVLLTGSIASADTMTFLGVNGATGYGYYVGPYYASLNGQLVTVYCVDFLNHVHFGQTWEANLTPLLSSDLSNTRFGGAFGMSDAGEKYQQAAWLTTQYALNTPADYALIQSTIWNLFVNTGLPSSLSLTGFLGQGQQMNYSGFYIVTNTNVAQTGQVQEFLVYAHTPEPSSMIILGTGVLLFGIPLVRRMRKRLMTPETPSS